MEIRGGLQYAIRTVAPLKSLIKSSIWKQFKIEFQLGEAISHLLP